MLSFPSANLQTLLLSNTSLCLPEILHNQPMHLCPPVPPSACPRQLVFPEAHHAVRPCSPCNPLAKAAHPATSQAGRACVLLSALYALHHSSSTHLQTHLPADTDATGLDHLSFLSCSLPPSLKTSAILSTLPLHQLLSSYITPVTSNVHTRVTPSTFHPHSFFTNLISQQSSCLGHLSYSILLQLQPILHYCLQLPQL